VRNERTIEIHVAPGIEDGQIIQVPKAGEVGERGADAGDLYVRVKIPEHRMFRREGATLGVRHEVSLVEVLVRRAVTVPTISGGSVQVEIPSGFKFGDQLLVSGEGMPHIGSHRRGDLVVHLDVRFPKKLSEKAKKLLEELRKEIE
jgi:DnaJ-class molecular chaperone